MLIPIDQIIPDPNQPRKTFKDETIDELKLSLKESNQVVPLLVRLNGDGQYMIITGERRYRAAKKSALKEVECIVRDNVSAGEARIMQLIDAIQHEDIPHDELGVAFRDYCKENNVSQRKLADKLGKSHVYVNDHIRIVENLEPSLQIALKEDKLEYSDARAMIRGVNSVNTQTQIAKPIIEGTVGRSKTQEYISKAKAKIKAEPTRSTEEVVKETVTEVLTPTIEKLLEKTPEEKEILESAKEGRTVMDDFYELSSLADKLYHGLGKLEQFPPAGKTILGISLQILRTRIDETLEKMDLKVIKTEAKQIEEVENG